MLLLFIISFSFLHCTEESFVSIEPEPFLGARPPMGWNSWNGFGIDINEDIIKTIADLFVSKGLRDVGYRYIVMDDGWHYPERDSQGNLVADPIKFPSGIQSLAQYIHSKGLKLGIYSDAGTNTCQGFPGSLNHEQQDANTFASWEIDYLKYDWCHSEGLIAEQAYSLMRQCLDRTGRSIMFSICEWGENDPWLWAPEIGQLWRTTHDIFDAHLSWVLNLENQIGLEEYAGPGHWNDPDMLIVGIHGDSHLVGSGCTDAEYRSHFSMWCIVAAPLMIGCDLNKVSEFSLETLTNQEAIAINQDPLGIQGYRIQNENGKQIWVKPLTHNNWAVALFNNGLEETDITFEWKDLNLHPSTVVKIRDVWLHKNLGQYSQSFTATVPFHEVVLLKITTL